MEGLETSWLDGSSSSSSRESTAGPPLKTKDLESKTVRILQDHPRLLEILYLVTRRSLLPLRGWLKPGSGLAAFLTGVEKISKGVIFDCRMCGQCVLHSTGMTCPMTCPKNLRNGPCGGVRVDGNCEVIPAMACVWVQAWERSKQMPRYGREILTVLPPLNCQLEGTSAWINDFTGEAEAPPGWES